MTHDSLALPRALVLATALLAGAAYADGPVASSMGAASISTSVPAAPTRHQLMKDCMAKERAADSGRPSYELSQDCRDITKTEKENADASKRDADSKMATNASTPH